MILVSSGIHIISRIPELDSEVRRLDDSDVASARRDAARIEPVVCHPSLHSRPPAKSSKVDGQDSELMRF